MLQWSFEWGNFELAFSQNCSLAASSVGPQKPISRAQLRPSADPMNRFFEIVRQIPRFPDLFTSLANSEFDSKNYPIYH